MGGISGGSVGARRDAAMTAAAWCPIAVAMTTTVGPAGVPPLLRATARATALRRRAWLGWVVGAAVAPTAGAPPPPVALEVAAASSLVDVLPDVALAFDANAAAPRIGLHVGASGTLLEQMARGAAWDVLVAANTETVARGVERHVLREGAWRAFAGNDLVLVVPARSLLAIRRLADLGQPDVLRIALGRAADVPAGRYARQAIDAQRLWPQLQRRIVDAASARDALARVVRGDVDAGFVYRTDAASAGDAVRVVETLSGHAPVRYVAAVSAAAREPARAAAFVDFLRSDAARAVLRDGGFAPV